MNEWVWSNGGMILTEENWSIGRKTLYSVGGRWMNEYGAMVEWYWQRKTEVLGEKHCTAWVVDEWMSMDQWWNDTDRGKLKYWEKNLSLCQSLCYKSKMDQPGIEFGPLCWKANSWPREPWHGPGLLSSLGKTRHPLYRRLGGPRASLDECEKSSPHLGSNSEPSSLYQITVPSMLLQFTERGQCYTQKYFFYYCFMFVDCRIFECWFRGEMDTP